MKRKDESKILAEQAFWKVLASGVPPTVDRVNNWLHENGHGRRDRAVINDAMKPCWQMVGEKAKQEFALPGVSPEAVTLFLKLHEDLVGAARAELAAERQQLRAEAAREIDVARAETQNALAEAELAKVAQRETATAYEALKADREQLRSELLEGRLQLDRERERLQDLLRGAEQKIGTLTTRLEVEASTLASERENSTKEQKRQALEIDALRTEARAHTAREKKLQGDLDTALSRERGLADKVRDLSAEMGTLRGSEGALRAQVLDLQVASTQQGEEATLLRGQLEITRQELRQRDLELTECRMAHAHCLPMNAGQLLELVAQTWTNAALAPGKPVSKEEDEQLVMATRGERYARRTFRALGISLPRGDGDGLAKSRH